MEVVTKAATSARGDEVVFKHKHYGYFSILKFLNPFARKAEAQHFSEELKRLLDSGSTIFDRICLVGHSFGTDIIAHALRSLPPEMHRTIDTIILSGSVLNKRYPWEKLLGTRVARLVNDCGNNDWILPLNAMLPFGSGVAGRNGFEGIIDADFCNRYFEFGHSGYFFKSKQRLDASNDNWFMERYWVPLLLDHGAIELIDERKSTALSGLMVSFVDRTERLKWVPPLIVGSLVAVVVWEGHSINQRAFRETRRADKENHDRLQNVVRQLAAGARDPTDSGDAVTGMLLAIEALSIQDNSALQPPVIEASQSLYTGISKNTPSARPANQIMVQGKAGIRYQHWPPRVQALRSHIPD